MKSISWEINKDIFNYNYWSFVMKFKWIIVVSCLLIILTLTAVSAADNETSALFNQLNVEINQTAEHETLILEKDYKHGDDNANITITKSITIDGKGHTIDGDKKGRIFYIAADNVTLKNINFVNGKALGLYHNLTYIGGGAIYWSGANGKLINCTFKNNEATGLLYDPYSEPDKVIDEGDGITTIIHIERPMGASTNRGGAIVWTGDNAFIDTCDFISNHVNYPNAGGAIYARANNFKIHSSKFKYNSAFYGHAICYFGDNLTVDSSTFYNNLGITSNSYIYGQNVTIINITVAGSFEDLANEINKTSKELYLTSDYKQIKGNSEGIIIDKSITIDGCGHTIDANNLGRIFWIKSDNVTLKNIVFICHETVNLTIFTSPLTEGVFNWSGSNGTILNCTFLYNKYSKNQGSFNDLACEIKNADGILVLDRDYSYSTDYYTKYVSYGNSDDGYVGENILISPIEIGHDEEGIIINKSITIDGGGHVLDGRGMSRIFNVVNGSVVFKNIIFRDGSCSKGSAICGESVVINSTFIDNYCRNTLRYQDVAPSVYGYLPSPFYHIGCLPPGPRFAVFKRLWPCYAISKLNFAKTGRNR